jgi:uncharacterized damage-inducible protein DinB
LIKQNYIENLNAARKTMINATDGLTEEELCRPMAEGKWSIKDTLGHLAAWEGEVVKAFEQKARGERPTIGDIKDFDSWNEVQAAERRSRSLAEIKREFMETRERLLAIVNGFPDDGDLWSPERSTAKMLGTLIQHDQHHSKSIREYRGI